MRKIVLILTFALVLPLLCAAQADRSEVRAGNRKFRKENWKESEIDYRKAVLKDSLSVAGWYDLAGCLYRLKDFEGASNALGKTEPLAAGGKHEASYHYNKGDVAIAQKDWRTAVDAFRECLLLTPDDMDAKENYIYAKQMLQNQEQQGGGQNNQDQNQDQQQNQDQNQDQDQRQNQDQNQDGQDNQEQQQPESGEENMTRQQAQQMLRAIQAREQETQEKVNKEKAALLKSRQKEKNW